jgi:hypothetical protein
MRKSFLVILALLLSGMFAIEAEAKWPLKVPKHINRSLDQVKRGAADAGGKISTGAKRMADNAGRGLAEIDQGRIAVMKDKQTMQAAGGIVGGMYGGPQGAAAGSHAAGVFIDGVNGRHRQSPPIVEQNYGSHTGYGQPQHHEVYSAGGLSADDIMKIRRQDHELRMQEFERMRPIHEEQSRMHQENSRRQNELNQTRTIIHGVLQGVQLLGQ